MEFRFAYAFGSFFSLVFSLGVLAKVILAN